MEKIVIFALVILSCVALSGSSASPMDTTTIVMTKSTNTSMVSPSATTSATTTAGVKPTPTSGTVSFTASAGLIVSLVMALLH